MQVLVSSNSTDQMQAVAGSISGGFVAAAGTVVIDNITNTTRAYIASSTVSATTGEVNVWANSTEQPNPNGAGDTLIAINASGGLVGVGGVVSVNTISDTTLAYIASSQINPNLSLTTQFITPGTVSVKATSQVNLLIASGGVAGGLVGVNGTVDRTSIAGKTMAFISSNDESGHYAFPTVPSIVNGYHVLVGSTSSETVQRTVIGGAGGLVGVAGSVSVLTVGVANMAYVHDSDVYAIRDTSSNAYQGDLTIAANDTTNVTSKVGSIAIGLVGAGAAIDDNSIQNVVEAENIGGRLNAITRNRHYCHKHRNAHSLYGHGIDRWRCLGRRDRRRHDQRHHASHGCDRLAASAHQPRPALPIGRFVRR